MSELCQSGWRSDYRGPHPWEKGDEAERERKMLRLLTSRDSCALRSPAVLEISDDLEARLSVITCSIETIPYSLTSFVRIGSNLCCVST